VRTRIACTIMTLLLVTGCASVGPDYVRQDRLVPARYSALETGISTGDHVRRDLLNSWWTMFQDPMLDGLMKRAVAGNLDLRIAKTRVQQARALSRASSSRLLPEGGLSGGYERLRRSETGAEATGGSGGRTTDLYLIGFDAAWEIDIFGGVRREIEAAEADLAASYEALNDTLVTLQGEVARNYVELRGLQFRLNIARQEVAIRRDNVVVTEARAKAGLVSELDSARARGELATAEARIPFLERTLMAAVYRLGVLLGQDPESLQADFRDPAQPPTVPANLPAGLPSELLRRRPDIRRAEREVAAATARIGVSTAELFPKFSLTGSFGFSSSRFDELLQDRNNFWTVGPTISWPILNVRRILAGVETSEAVQQEALARYEKTVLLSLEEVENALVALSRERRRVEALANAVQENDLAVQLAMDRYLAGLQSFLAVTDAQAALYTAEDQLAQSREKLTLAFVALYKALGGGWLES
jgi:outer membrane protein, multidrug efflux system